MWLKILFSLLVLFAIVAIVIAMWSPQRRRAVHQFFVLLAKIVLAVAVVGAAIAYYKRHYLPD